MKFVLSQNSNTQRITAKLQKDNTVLLNKEFRKNIDDEWKVGKGITVGVDRLIFLSEILKHKGEVLNALLSSCEIIEEDDPIE